jgi:hypothetical protein
MKTFLSAQHLSYFRRQGHVQFENFSINFDLVKSVAKSVQRDLWRKNLTLKKFILQQLGPIALELTKSNTLHLACDQWIDSPLKEGPMKSLFCFQNLACIFVFSSNTLDVYEPSSLSSKIPHDAYVVIFAKENGVLVENPNDRFTVQTRNLGYVYGDRLKNEFHPLIRNS